MYKLFFTNDPIFWDNVGEDKPNKDFLNTIKWIEVDDGINPNFLSQYEGSIFVPQKMENVKYFKVVDNEKELFYFVSSIGKKMKTGLVLNLDLDIWASYAVKLFEMGEVNVDILRTHIFNDNHFQIEDTLLNSIPLSYDENIQHLEEVEGMIAPNLFQSLLSDYANKIQMWDVKYYSKSDIMGGNVFYIWSGGFGEENDGFNIFPVLSQNYIMSLTRSTYEYSATFTDDYQIDNPFDSSNNFYQKQYIKLKELSKNNPKNNTWLEGDGTDDSKKPFSTELPEDTQPNDMEYKNTIEKVENNFVKTTEIFLKGKLIYTGKKTSEKDEIINWVKIIFNFHGIILKKYDYSLRNYIAALDSLLGNSSLINKFVGVFMLPNFSHFSEKFKFYEPSELLYFHLRMEGFKSSNKIKLWNGDYKGEKLKNEIPTIYNNENVESFLLTKYLNISYYGNKKNWLAYFENGELSLYGLFIFMGNGLLLHRNNFEICGASIIKYPYQLPSATDGYIKYYSGIQSSVNNGLRQNNEQSNMNLAKNVFGATMGIAGAAASMVANPVGGAMSMASTVGNSAMGIATGEMSRKNYIKGVAAQFEDAKRVSSTDINVSSVEDASFINTNYISGGNYESVMFQGLTKQSARLLNNLLYLYGNMYPSTFKISELQPRPLFNYVEIGKTWIDRNIPILFNENIDIKNTIATTYSTGLRLWKVWPKYGEN